jgi:hypothetical protein
MFVGAIPIECIEQLAAVMPVESWRLVYSCCSGSFRADEALGSRFPMLSITSNDVALLSCAIGKLAVGDELPLTFKERLAFAEDAIGGAKADPMDRVAAVMVAFAMSKFKGNNLFAQKHFAHYQEHFAHYVAGARERLEKRLSSIRITGFNACDFREHAKEGIARGAAIVAFPPTYKRGYEAMYKFLEQNVNWTPPTYDLWDPELLPEWVTSLDEAGAKYAIWADHLLPGREPVAGFFSSTNKPVYLYGSSTQASVRRKVHPVEAFRYVAVTPEQVKKDATVSVVRATSAQMNFLKDHYLAKGIAHISGQFNFLVLLSGRLVGGFILARDKFGHGDSAYLLSDFSIVRENRLSKLVAMMATSRPVIDIVERALFQRIRKISTTAFTDKPVSMKYRWIFTLVGRKEKHLNYESAVRPGDYQSIYREWFRKYAQAGDPGGRAAPGGAAQGSPS